MPQKKPRAGRRAEPGPRLPDVQQWQPRADASESLSVAFRRRCRYSEQRLLLQFSEEQEGNLDNFDSGIGLEEILRNELRELLPRRYGVTTGVVTDRRGYTAGHCDLVIFNEDWFPLIKPPAVEGARRPYLPIEGAYAILEIKQSLSEKSLDRAMEKLVQCHRLHRPLVPYDRVVENRQAGYCNHFYSNPLYTAVVAVDVAGKSSFDDLIVRFFQINKQLRRREMVRALVVLNRGYITWAYVDEQGEVRPAWFASEDQFLPLYPALIPRMPDDSILYPFIQGLSNHLYRCVLGPEDVVSNYGEQDSIGKVNIPKKGWYINPDKETLDSFGQSCSHSADVHWRDAQIETGRVNRPGSDGSSDPARG